MKKVVFLLIFVAFSEMGFSQNEGTPSVRIENADDVIYTATETKPEYEGGIKEFYSYIGNNFRVPNIKGLKGKVIVQFVVEKDGSLGDIKVLRDVGYGTGEEAKRVLSNSPKWKPGTQKGVAVRVLYSLPINVDTTKYKKKPFQGLFL